MGVFFIVKKSDDECCFDSLSVRMQRFTRENIDKHGRITGKCCRHKLSKTEVKLMKQKNDSAKRATLRKQSGLVSILCNVCITGSKLAVGKIAD